MTGRSGRGIVRAAALCAAFIAALWLGYTDPSLGQASVPISAFFGQWAGSGVSQTEESIVFQYTQRDLNVTIRAAGNGSAVNWTTVQRQKGDPNDPTPERKDTGAVFLPTGRPNLWRAEGALEPLSGNAYSWASLRGQTLTINSMTITQDGGYEMQIYNRTLSGLGMTLEFIRLENGAVRRTVRGQLIKQAN